MRKTSFFVSNNGADIRAVRRGGELVPVGARPIGSDWDDMFVVDTGGNVEWFGFPLLPSVSPPPKFFSRTNHKGAKYYDQR